MDLADFNSVPVYSKLDHIIMAVRSASVPGCYLEFGVYQGRSINLIADVMWPNVVYGFDSWQGLPAHWQVGDSIARPIGHFALSPADPRPALSPNIDMYVGWFDETIPQWIEIVGEPISFIHIDSDLYQSAMDVLQGLNDYIVPGTVIAFDEYANWPEGKRLYTHWRAGEYKALNDWLSQCNRKAMPLMRNNEYGASIVML